MKHTLTILLLLGFALHSNAQKKEFLIGHWKFEAFGDRQEENPQMLELKESVFKKMTFSFKINGRYQSLRETGDWRLNGSESEIIFTSDDGYEDAKRLLKSSKDTLIIEMGMKKEPIIFSRMSSMKEGDFEETPIKLERMSASIKGISKKWYLQKKDTPPVSTDNEEPSLFPAIPTPPYQIKGSYIKLSEEGEYKAQFDKNRSKTNSTWTFREDNKTIVVSLGVFENMIWNIHKISENELILIKGNRAEEKWYFSTKKLK